MTEITGLTEKTQHTYGCQKCKTMIAKGESIICGHFRGLHGKATLFESVANVTHTHAEEREMTTGVNKTQEFHCNNCDEYLGWTYLAVPNASQEYKLGNHILEMECIMVLPQTL